MIGISIAMMLLSIISLDFFGLITEERPVEQKTFWYFISALVLAPAIETFIFQKLPIDFFWESFSKKWPLLIISATPFGILHYFKEYFFRDILYSFGCGVIFAYAYILAKKREDMSAFLVVSLIHAGYNLFGVVAHLIVD